MLPTFAFALLKAGYQALFGEGIPIMFEYLDAKIREYQEMISNDPEMVRMQLELIRAENMFIAS
jgi:hypothetical protein